MMSNDTTRPEPEEAREALASVDEAKRAGLRRGIPPRWFGAAIALIAGALVATPALENWQGGPNRSLVTVLLIVAMALVISRYQEQARAWPTEFPGGRWKTLAMLVSAVAAFFFLLIGGIVLRDASDLWWGPVFTGAIGAVIVFFLFESERRDYLARSTAEDA